MFKVAALVKTHQVSNSSKVGHGIEFTLVVNQFFSSIILRSYRVLSHAEFRVTKHTTSILSGEKSLVLLTTL